MTNRGFQNDEIHFCVPVWGSCYIDKYLSYSLPCQLASQNLPAVRKTIHSDILYHVYTTPDGKQEICRSIFFSSLSSYVTICFHDINALPGKAQSKYNTLNRCYEDVSRIALNKGAIVFLWADLILANGAILYICKKLIEGYQIILSGNLRVLEEDTKTELDHHRTQRNAPIEITGDQLCRLAVTHLHPRVSMTFTNSYQFDNSWPDYLYWQLPRKGIIQCGLFLVPMAMIAHKEIVLGNVTLDLNPSILEGYPDHNTWHVPENGREFIGITLCQANEFEHMAKRVGVFSAMHVGNWMLEHLSEQQVSLLNKKIRICGIENEQALNQLEPQLNLDVERIMQAYHVLAQYPGLSEDIRTLTALTANEPNWLTEIPPKINKLIHNLGGRPLVVYGVGQHTELLLRCTDLRYHVTALSDSNPQMWGTTQFRINCVAPDRIIEYAEDILISSRSFEKEIFQNLRARFEQKVNIFLIYDNGLLTSNP